MGLISREIWRNYNTDGVPASGPHEPNKRDIQSWGTWLESLLSAGSSVAFATLASLSADLAHAANTAASVYGDASPANNGIYLKNGASGGGSWTRIADLPNEVLRLTVTGGTANAIQASASSTPTTPGNKLYLLVPTANNSGATTLALNGGSAVPITDALGSALVNGSLLSGAQYLLGFSVDHYQALISQPVDASGVLADAVTARNDAQAAAASAIAAAAGANSIMVSRVALAAATVAASVKAVICAGYAAAGDCAPFTLKRVDSQPEYGGVRSTDRYLSNGTVDSGNGGWWIYVAGTAGVDACAFGVKADWNGDDATATPNAVALQNAINFTALQFGGNGVDTGGGAGGDLLVPHGSMLIEAGVIVHDGVRVLGKGMMGTLFVIAQAFPTGTHRFRLGTPGDVASVCASQSRGSAGDLVINGTNASGGVARFLRKKSLRIYSAGNDSGRTFTVYYIDAFGAAQSIAVTGANAGSADVALAGGIRIVTRIAVNGATASTVTVGNVADAAFGSRLEKLQLFSTLLNSVSGVSMVYTDNAQHDGGLYEVKIFGGNARCAFFETGVGGASRFTFEKVETFNHGNGGGASASTNAQITLNYGGLLSPIRDIVMGCPGNAYVGASAIGLEITGGFIAGDTIHPDVGIPTGIRINNATVNQGMVILRNVEGALNVDRLIWIDSGVDNNTVLLEGIYPNGAVLTVKDDPGAATVTGNILAPTVF